MTEEYKDDSLTKFLFGLAIGGFVVYLILRRSTQSSPISSIDQLYGIMKLSGWQPPQDIYNMNHLHDPMSVQQAYQPQTYQPIEQMPIRQTDTNTLYKNKESWEFVRDLRGYIKKVDVIRDVKSDK